MHEVDLLEKPSSEDAAVLRFSKLEAGASSPHLLDGGDGGSYVSHKLGTHYPHYPGTATRSRQYE